MSLGVGFGVSEAQVRSSVSLFLLFVDPDIGLSATSSAPCLPACHHASHLDAGGCRQKHVGSNTVILTLDSILPAR